MTAYSNKRRKPPAQPNRARWGATCDWCGKRDYDSKQDAKRAIKRHHDRMSAYPCRHAPDWADPGWHIGHLAEDVIHGNKNRHDIYGNRAA